MHIFYFFFRAVVGILTFNLPMRFVPHLVSSSRLVAIMAVASSCLHFFIGGFGAIFNLIAAQYFWRLGNKKDGDSPSLAVSVCFIAILIDIIVSSLILLSMVGNLDGGKGSEFLIISFWQFFAFVFYAKIVFYHHKKMMKENRVA